MSRRLYDKPLNNLKFGEDRLCAWSIDQANGLAVHGKLLNLTLNPRLMLITHTPIIVTPRMDLSRLFGHCQLLGLTPQFQ